MILLFYLQVQSFWETGEQQQSLFPGKYQLHHIRFPEKFNTGSGGWIFLIGIPEQKRVKKGQKKGVPERFPKRPWCLLICRISVKLTDAC
ncbi:MAG: hypothetical protein C4518_09525 [Desulfobacteraceae bacterium]|nr:MAG: hypothetical protein C4518_09525 [Desulfobacteraceae bacterium]